MEKRVETVHELSKKVATDEALKDRIKADPVKALTELAYPPPPPPLQWDQWIYRIVVASLGLVVLIAISGAVGLAACDKKDIPDVITALGSAAVGALAGLLAPVPARSEPPRNQQ